MFMCKEVENPFFRDKSLKHSYDPNLIVSAFIPNQPFSSWPTVIFIEKFETANWSLRRGDEQVDKRIKQKYVYWNKLPNISAWKQTFFRGEK